jgi:hypothetical protein
MISRESRSWTDAASASEHKVFTILGALAWPMAAVDALRNDALEANQEMASGGVSYLRGWQPGADLITSRP